MPDIAMCQNESCPDKEKCYRYMAIPDMQQTYCNFDRIFDGCDYFLQIRKGQKIQKLAADVS